MSFTLWAKVPQFTARKKIGLRANMSLEQREILDAIDVVEQKSDKSLEFSVRALNLFLIIALLLLALEGPTIGKVFQKWAGGDNVPEPIRSAIDRK